MEQNTEPKINVEGLGSYKASDAAAAQRKSALIDVATSVSETSGESGWSKFYNGAKEKLMSSEPSPLINGLAKAPELIANIAKAIPSAVSDASKNIGSILPEGKAPTALDGKPPVDLRKTESNIKVDPGLLLEDFKGLDGYVNASKLGVTLQDYFPALNPVEEKPRATKSDSIIANYDEQGKPIMPEIFMPEVGGFAKQIPFIGAHVNYEPPNDTVSKVRYELGSIVGFLAAAGGSGGLLGGARSAEAPRIGLNLWEDGGVKFLQNQSYQKSIATLESTMPKISKILFQKAGMEKALDETMQMALKFGVLVNTTMSTDTKLRERVMNTASTMLMALPMTVLGNIPQFSLRVGAHGAFGMTMARLGGGNTEDTVIQGAIWSALGSMGGFGPATQMNNKQLQNFATEYLDKIPEISKGIKEIDALPRRGDVPVPSEAIPRAKKIIAKADEFQIGGIGEKIIAKADEFQIGGIGEKIIAKADESQIGGIGEKISYTERGIGNESVKFWEEKIKAGEKPSVTVGRDSSGNRVVIDGNHTLNAYKNLGIDEIPVIEQKTGSYTSTSIPPVLEGMSPEVVEWSKRYAAQSKIVDLAEKQGNVPLTPDASALMDKEPFDWKAFSTARGYTGAEMNDFQKWLDLVKEGETLGLTKDKMMEIQLELAPNPRNDYISMPRTKPSILVKIEKLHEENRKLDVERNRHIKNVASVANEYINDRVKSLTIKELYSPEEIAQWPDKLIELASGKLDAKTARTYLGSEEIGAKGNEELFVNFSEKVRKEYVGKGIKLSEVDSKKMESLKGKFIDKGGTDREWKDMISNLGKHEILGKGTSTEEPFTEEGFKQFIRTYFPNIDPADVRLSRLSEEKLAEMKAKFQEKGGTPGEWDSFRTTVIAQKSDIIESTKTPGDIVYADILERIFDRIGGGSEGLRTAMKKVEGGVSLLKTEQEAMRSLLSKYGDIPKYARDYRDAIFEYGPNELANVLSKKSLEFKLEPEIKQGFVKALDEFSATNGSRGALADSINKAIGKTSLDRRENILEANKFLDQLNIKNIDELNLDLNMKYKDIFDPIKTINENFDKFAEKSLDGEYLSLDPVKYNNKDVIAIEKAVEKGMVFREPTFSDETKLSSYASLEKTLQDSIDAIFLSTGPNIKLPAGVLGSASGDQAAIFKAKDFGTRVEEYSHLQDAHLGLSQRLKDTYKTNPTNKAIMEELVSKLPDWKKNTYPKSDWVNESMAEVLGGFIRGEVIKDTYPLADRYVQGMLSELDPATLSTLKQIRLQAQTIGEAPLLDRSMAATYKNEDLVIRKGIFEAFKDGTTYRKFRAAVKEGYRGQLNVGENYKEMDKYYGKDVMDPASASYKVSMMKENISGFAKMLMERGVPENLNDFFSMKNTLDINTKTKGFKQIMESLPEETHRYFSEYRKFEELIQRYESAAKNGEKYTLPEGYKIDELRWTRDYMKNKFPDFNVALNEIKTFYDEMRLLEFTSGHISGESFDMLVQNPRFAGLMRKGGVLDHDFNFNMRYNDTINKAGFKGSLRDDIVDPAIQMVTEIQGISKRIMKNNMYSTLANTLEEGVASGRGQHKWLGTATAATRSTEVRIKELVDTLRNSKEFNEKELLDMQTLAEKHPNLILEFFRPHQTDTPNIKSYFKDGKVKYIRVEKQLSDLIDGQLKDSEWEALTSKVKAYTSFKRNLATTFSPLFVVKNLLRDSMTAYFNADAPFIPFIDSVVGMKHYMRGVMYGDDPVYANFMAHGGNRLAIGLEGTDTFSRQLFERQNKGRLAGIGVKFMDFMENLSQGSEIMTRLGVLAKYDQANPKELAKGIYDAMQATMPWGQRGYSDSFVSQMNKYNAFSKASLIVVDKTVRMFGKENAYTTVKRLSKVMAASFAYAYYQKDNDKYWEMPSFRNMMGINIPNGSGGFWTIPFTGNFFMQTAWSTPQLMAHWIHENDKTSKEQVGKGLGELVNNAMPLGIGVTGSGGSEGGFNIPLAATKVFIPDAAKSIIEALTEFSLFTGQNWVPDYMKGLPVEEQYDKSTPESAILMSKAWNATFGKGSKELSPIAMYNILRGNLFGMYDFANGYIDFVAQKFGVAQNDLKKELGAKDLFPISAFYHEEYDPNMSYEVQKLTDRYLRYQKYYNAYNKHLTSNPTKAVEYYNDNIREIQDYTIIAGGRDSVATMMATYRLIQSDKTKTDDEKKPTLDSLRDAMKMVSQQVNETMDQFEFTQRSPEPTQ